MTTKHDLADEHRKSRQADGVRDGCSEPRGSSVSSGLGALSDAPRLIRGSGGLVARRNVAARTGAMQHMQQVYGNRAAQRFVQRSPAPAQQGGLEEEQEDGAWPHWLSNVTNQVRAMAGLAGKDSRGAGGSAPAPMYGPLPPTTPRLETFDPVYGPIAPATMAPPSVPASGQLGHVAPYSVPAGQAQPPAEYLLDEQGNQVLNDNGNPIRTTENEHVIPRSASSRCIWTTRGRSARIESGRQRSKRKWPTYTRK